MQSYKAFKLGSVIANFILLLFALTLIIVGIHMIIDHGLMLEITNGSVYLTGTYLLIFCGIVLVFAAGIGVVGSLKEHRFLLIAYIVLLIIVLIFTFIGGILVLVLPASVDDNTKSVMRTTLSTQYNRTKLYTDAWDMTQKRLRCCGVDDYGWAIYVNSYWDSVENVAINIGSKITQFNVYYKYVPSACCWTLIDTQTGWPSERHLNLYQCQNFKFGPPNFPNGAQNDAIYYTGCATAMKSFLEMYSKGLGGVAIFLVLILIVAVILAVFQLRKLRKEDKREKEIIERDADNQQRLQYDYHEDDDDVPPVSFPEEKLKLNPDYYDQQNSTM